MKICTKCLLEKGEDAFSLTTKRGKPYQSSQCKICILEKRRIYALKNKDKIKEYQAAYRQEHPEKWKYNLDSWAKNKNIIKIQRQARKDKNPELWSLTKRKNKNTQKTKARELIRELKNSPCSDCGKNYHFNALDFDHRNPEEKHQNIGHMVQQGRGIEAILQEVAKCDLVCVNCHRIRTFLKNPRLTAGPLNEAQRLSRTSKDVPCADCGIKYHFCAMDFDHKNMSEKSFTISGRYSSININKLKAEIEKCEVVCANCHRIRTYAQLAEFRLTGKTNKSTDTNCRAVVSK